MLQTILKGFTIGLAYLAPIGMQNLYVINSAICRKRSQMYMVVFTTIFFDISLSLACFFGIGFLMDKFLLFKLIILLVGSITIIMIGIQLIKSSPSLDSSINVEKNFIQTIISCFFVTWANPQALLDGTLLFGGLSTTLPPHMTSYFILGACLASFIWFFCLGSLVSIFRKSFNAKALKIINMVCGSVIIYYGFKLAYNFLDLI